MTSADNRESKQWTATAGRGLRLGPSQARSGSKLGETTVVLPCQNGHSFMMQGKNEAICMGFAWFGVNWLRGKPRRGRVNRHSV